MTLGDVFAEIQGVTSNIEGALAALEKRISSVLLKSTVEKQGAPYVTVREAGGVE